MKYPIDASDAASLVQADWHEEYGDAALAEQIRETVTEPVANSWHRVWPWRYVLNFDVVGQPILAEPHTPPPIAEVGTPSVMAGEVGSGRGKLRIDANNHVGSGS